MPPLGWRLRGLALAVALAAPVVAAPVVPASAALLHQYSFNNSTTDAAGSMNATLNGNAAVSSGSLVLDGSTGTYAQLSGYAIPNTDFTITFTATIAAYSGGTVEMISQGTSGAPGFYIGLSSGVFRLGDTLGSTSVATPSLGVSHSYELISSSTSGTQFFIDGATAFTSATAATAPQSGTDTRIGAQFQTYGENFDGSISNLSIYSGLPSVPEPASWTLLALGVIGLPVLRRRRG